MEPFSILFSTELIIIIINTMQNREMKIAVKTKTSSTEVFYFGCCDMTFASFSSAVVVDYTFLFYFCPV